MEGPFFFSCGAGPHLGFSYPYCAKCEPFFVSIYSKSCGRPRIGLTIKRSEPDPVWSRPFAFSTESWTVPSIPRWINGTDTGPESPDALLFFVGQCILVLLLPFLIFHPPCQFSTGGHCRVGSLTEVKKGKVRIPERTVIARAYRYRDCQQT